MKGEPEGPQDEGPRNSSSIANFNECNYFEEDEMLNEILSAIPTPQGGVSVILA